nr:MAG TPA: hypothetical protein [Caudoviricetes sp.]
MIYNKRSPQSRRFFLISKLLCFGYQNLKVSKKKIFLENSTIVVDFLF